MIAVDHRRADSERQGDGDAEALVRRNVIQMLILDVSPAKPLQEILGSGGDERMPGRNLPSNGDAESHSPQIEVFFARDVFRANDRAARTVIVVCKTDLAHKRVLDHRDDFVTGAVTGASQG